MRTAKMIAGVAIVLATFGGSAAHAGQAPERGCVAIAGGSCSYVATARGGVIGWGQFEVKIERGRRVIKYSHESRSLVPVRPSLQIRPRDRVTINTRLTWIGVACVGAPWGTFVRAGSESYLLNSTL